jgi:hypothetical protein
MQSGSKAALNQQLSFPLSHSDPFRSHESELQTCQPQTSSATPDSHCVSPLLTKHIYQPPFAAYASHTSDAVTTVTKRLPDSNVSQQNPISYTTEAYALKRSEQIEALDLTNRKCNANLMDYPKHVPNLTASLSLNELSLGLDTPLDLRLQPASLPADFLEQTAASEQHSDTQRDSGHKIFNDSNQSQLAYAAGSLQGAPALAGQQTQLSIPNQPFTDNSHQGPIDLTCPKLAASPETNLSLSDAFPLTNTTQAQPSEPASALSNQFVHQPIVKITAKCIKSPYALYKVYFEDQSQPQWIESRKLPQQMIIDYNVERHK